MARSSKKSRETILAAAERFMKERRAGAVTVEAIARSAGCAKGLVHYHFKTKNGLIQSLADRLAASRERRWSTAFDAPSATEAIDRTWKLLTTESKDGTLQAWSTLLSCDVGLTDSAVRDLDSRFSSTLRDRTIALLADSGLEPTVPDDEIGWYLGAVINGMGVHLRAGMDEEGLEGAYVAAWAGVLSLTTARPLTASGRGDRGGASLPRDR